MNQKLIDLVRKTYPEKLAKELIGVQSIDPNLYKEMIDNSVSEEQLLANGYEPVDPLTKLLWKQKA